MSIFGAVRIDGSVDTFLGQVRDIDSLEGSWE
jgi:hypothetical protein